MFGYIFTTIEGDDRSVLILKQNVQSRLILDRFVVFTYLVKVQYKQLHISIRLGGLRSKHK
ncbi:hypothetical protein J2Y37_000502 [Prolinoborus sp. 3657]|nr:hypothetical protein [Prolinoborus sp. 3657]